MTPTVAGGHVDHGHEITGIIEVDGCPVRWFGWGDGEPAIMLLHGGGAHTGWWARTITAMGPEQRVVSIDLSGNGDSGHRKSYSNALWAEEITAVAEHVVRGPIILVAHSMNGRVGALAAARRPDIVAGLVLVESIIPTRGDEIGPPTNQLRVYPDLESAVARFRLRPARGRSDPVVLSALARTCLRRVESGWTWKFDPRSFGAADLELINEAIPAIDCPVAFVIADQSPVTHDWMITDFETALGRPLSASRILKGADHHFMLDRPHMAAELLADLELTAPH